MFIERLINQGNAPMLEQTVTPLPAARPSALITASRPSAASSSTKTVAGSISWNTPQRAIGTPAAAAMSWQNALDDSIRAAARDGPKTANPASARASATPAASGASFGESVHRVSRAVNRL